MQVTTVEEVTRTYCDVCKIDITRKAQCGAGLDKPDESWVTCSETKFYVQKYEHTVELSCSDIARLRHNYPILKES